MSGVKSERDVWRKAESLKLSEILTRDQLPSVDRAMLRSESRMSQNSDVAFKTKRLSRRGSWEFCLIADVVMSTGEMSSARALEGLSRWLLLRAGRSPCTHPSLRRLDHPRASGNFQRARHVLAQSIDDGQETRRCQQWLARRRIR